MGVIFFPGVDLRTILFAGETFVWIYLFLKNPLIFLTCTTSEEVGK